MVLVVLVRLHKLLLQRLKLSTSLLTELLVLEQSQFHQQMLLV